MPLRNSLLQLEIGMSVLSGVRGVCKSRMQQC